MYPRDARRSVNQVRQLLSTYKELYSGLRSARNGLTPIKGLVGDPYKTTDDSWLIKAGLAMIAFPDPTISDLIGTGMVMVGLLRKHTTPLTIAEVGRKLRTSMRELNEFTVNGNGTD